MEEISSHSNISKILSGDKRSIARAITAIESGQPKATEMLKGLFAHTGRAVVIGITGAPGAGKSTLVDGLASYYRLREQRVGIIAVDPSSPFTGGAILGDRIRMQNMATDPGIFIRSMAARGHLGGLARATTDAVAVLDAGGYGTIMIETVGVGQDEIDIVKTADVTVVVLVPGMGDDIQAIKAGLMEIADLFVINKADRDGVERTEREIQSLLSISQRPDGWSPRIVRTVAIEKAGIDLLARAVDEYIDYFRSEGSRIEGRRTAVAEHRIVEMLRDRLFNLALERGVTRAELRRLAQSVADRSRDPYSVVDEIIEHLDFATTPGTRGRCREGEGKRATDAASQCDSAS
jgi:LAO/AO transport system kinase